MKKTGERPMISVAMALLAATPCLNAEGPPAPLAKLPSRPGAHVKKIKAMEDDFWIDLGTPAADPKWGRARGRSWTSQMPLAPELRGAFLQGEEKHGYTKPDGHYTDDLWFYDINAHRWICCHPGAPAKTLRLTLNADGSCTALAPIATMMYTRLKSRRQVTG